MFRTSGEKSLEQGERCVGVLGLGGVLDLEGGPVPPAHLHPAGCQHLSFTSLHLAHRPFSAGSRGLAPCAKSIICLNALGNLSLPPPPACP